MSERAHKKLSVQKTMESWITSPPRTLSVDTEFIWRNTYWPQPALLQFCHKDQGFFLDPLNYSDKDFEHLRNLIANPNTLKIFHAAHDDLVILKRLFNHAPVNFVDTQHAALFCGESLQMGLDKLTSKVLGIELDKSYQESNWLQRPLDPEQLNYALQDVAYLEEIWEIQKEILEKKGVLSWFQEDMSNLIEKIDAPLNPWESWKQIPPKNTSPRSMAYAQHLGAWRQLHAEEQNMPIQHVVSHETLSLWCSQPQKTEMQWLKILKENNLSLSKNQQDIFFTFLEDARNFPLEEAPKWPHRRLSKKEDLLLKALKKELSVIAQELQLPEFLLASRKDLIKLLWGKESRLNKGWRYNIFTKNSRYL